MERTRNASLDLDPRGFVWASPDHLAEVDLEDARACVAAAARLAGPRARVVVDMRRLKSMTRDARLYFGGNEAAAICLAVAIVVDGPLSRVLGNFFLRASVKRMPHRLFDTEEAAVAWALGPFP